MLQKNVGTLDGALRILIGMSLIFAALADWFYPWGWVGIVLVVTALTGNCMLYSILGIKTCSTCKKG
ncbi:MAG: DUF2892 domain-containing protein [Mariprofundaceae bacterium]|nr:DUF2892 domain-containing protein [Mariprofundaceae bacterium]